MRPQAVVFLIFLLQQSYNHFHPSLKVYNTLWLLFPMQWTVCTCSSDAVLEKSSLKTKLRFNLGEVTQVVQVLQDGTPVSPSFKSKEDIPGDMQLF